MPASLKYCLRPWRKGDEEALCRYANNHKIARFMTDAFPHPYTPDHATAFIDKVSGAEPINVLAIEVNGEAVGSIGIFQQTDIMRKSAELGYWLGEPYWGNNIVPRAVADMVDYGFRLLDITRIYARPFGGNAASQRVLEKAGFKLEARIKDNIYKNGAYEDELIYAVRRQMQADQ